MNELEVIGQVLESKVAVKTYDDVASPGFKELGKVGSDLVKTARLFLVPLQIAAVFQDRLERFLRELNERVPEERRIEVPPEISGPAIDSMRFLDENSALWEMFKELLVKSADREAVGFVHPSFVHIVKQLTRDEAFMLFMLKNADFKIVDTMDFNKADNKFYNRKIESSTIPENELLNPCSVNIYSAHLESLSLACWPVIKQDPIMVGAVQVGIRRHSIIQLTEFGQLFVTACLPPSGIA